MQKNIVQSIFWKLWLSLAFFKIMGLATLSMDNMVLRKKGPKILSAFLYSRWGNVYNSILVILMIGSNYLSIPYIYHFEYPNKSNLTTYIEIIEALLGTFVVCGILLSYCVHHTSMVTIGNRLLHVEDRMCHIKRTFERQRILPTLITVWLINVIICISVVTTEHFAFYDSPIAWLADIVPTFFSCWIAIQYFSIVTIIGADFIDVNHGIKNLSRDLSGEYRAESLYQARRVFVSSSTNKSLIQLRAVYTDLCEISTEVAEFYSLPILFGIFLLFVTLVYNAYYLVTPLVTADEPLEYMVFLNTICWVICIIYPMLLLTIKITKVAKEIEKTGSIVHCLLSCAIDQETKSELKEFSLQLLHRNIKFTASGYFILDNTLFHSMLGAVTTYLVILIQFQMASTSDQ